MRYVPTEAPGRPADAPYIGYAIGTSVGPAVVRNRIRRRLRAALVELSPELSNGLYLVGVRNRRAAEVDFAVLCADLRNVTAEIAETP